MGKKGVLLLAFGIECCLIAFIAVACSLNSLGFAVFYNIGYGLLMSVLIPLTVAKKHTESWPSFGIKALHQCQFLVLFVFIIFSVGGQLIPLLLNGISIRFDLFPICILPLIMTTFFEEFLFRGFLQTRLECTLGWPLAILISGFLFSFYHVGYPGFRRVEDLLLLFVVGIGFAAAFKLSGNNLWVSYFVNLPNAFITYMLKSEQFPVFTWTSSVYASISLLLIGVVCLSFSKTMRR